MKIYQNKIKKEYSLEDQSNGTTCKHWKKRDNGKNSENVPHLEITVIILIYCSFINNDYQQKSRVLYTFVLNKYFEKLLDISPKKWYF